MNFYDVVRSRRSIRKFTNQPVSHELIAQVVETASYAPSWKHTQITRYIAVEGEKKNALAKCTSIFPGNGVIMENAPMVVAVTIIKGRSGYERDGSFSTPKGDRWQMFDAGIAAQTFCLVAHEKGLGTVIQGYFDEDEVRKVVELPEDQEIAALIPLGYPDIDPEAPPRKDASKLLTFK